jgi:hypothetical protein
MCPSPRGTPTRDDIPEWLGAEPRYRLSREVTSGVVVRSSVAVGSPARRRHRRKNGHRTERDAPGGSRFAHEARHESRLVMAGHRAESAAPPATPSGLGPMPGSSDVSKTRRRAKHMRSEIVRVNCYTIFGALRRKFVLCHEMQHDVRKQSPRNHEGKPSNSKATRCKPGLENQGRQARAGFGVFAGTCVDSMMASSCTSTGRRSDRTE